MNIKWSCNNCGYILSAETPPDECPSCKQKCSFRDVTCYTLECGGQDSNNIDPRLI